MRAGPIPGTSSRSSTDRKGPFDARQSTIFCAVTGPIPGSSSSCSMVAIPRLTFEPAAGAPGSTARARRCATRHDHLLPVGERRREIDRREVCSVRRAACAYERVGDPRAVRDPEEARPANVADHVDEELCPSGVGPGLGREPRQRLGLGRPLVRADPGDPRPRHGEERQKRDEEQRELRAREIDHTSRLADEPSRECAVFVPSVCRFREERSCRTQACSQRTAHGKRE